MDLARPNEGTTGRTCRGQEGKGISSSKRRGRPWHNISPGTACGFQGKEANKRADNIIECQLELGLSAVDNLDYVTRPRSKSVRTVANDVSQLISVYYQHIRGVCMKLNLLREAIPLSSYNIIIFIEIWLYDKIDTTELGFFVYDVFRCHRNIFTSESKSGSGVLIAVVRGLNCVGLPTFIDSIEHVFMKFLIDTITHIIGIVYIPPNAGLNKYVEMCDKFEDVINSCLGETKYYWGF